MPNFNSITMVGHTTRDPSCKDLGNSLVAEFGLATSRRYKDKNGELLEKTTFVEIKCWNKTADFVSKYITKGAPVLVSGELLMDEWEDKDGNRRTKLYINAQTIQSLSKRDGGQSAKPTAPNPANSTSSVDTDDDPPF